MTKNISTIDANLQALRAGISALKGTNHPLIRQRGLAMQPAYGSLSRALDEEQWSAALTWLDALETSFGAITVLRGVSGTSVADLVERMGDHCRKLREAVH